MKEYFDKEIIRYCEIYCKAVYPEEACGFILEDNFIPIQNVAEDKIQNFEISNADYIKYNDQIKAIVHSHADYDHLSKQDMVSQISSGVPWGVVFLKNGNVQYTFFWGDQLEPQELLGRPFIHGLYDCYALVRDYYRSEKGILLKSYPRENLWWEKDPSMLMRHHKDANFYQIDESEVKEGDVIFMQIMSDVVNHSGIYLNDGLILHHLYGKLSRREPLNRWRKYVTHYMRYDNA